MIRRALVSAASDCAGGPRSDDGRGCAKLAIVSIDRSRAALEGLRGTFGVDRIDPLIAIPGELTCGLGQRFPDARAFVRPGLDCPSRSSIRAWPEAIDRRLARRRKSCGR